MAWSDIQNTTVSFRGFLGIFLLIILLVGAFNWFFVMISTIANPYYTEDTGLDAKKNKSQDAFEVSSPASKDLLHWLGKRMSKGLRLASNNEHVRYLELQTAKQTGGGTSDEKAHDALKALTLTQFLIYLLVALTFFIILVSLIANKVSGTEMLGVVAGGK
tara:strand:+ start:1728 stop:2210 length:483 start_codon:yes stop_codon:yes gene_type:complete